MVLNFDFFFQGKVSLVFSHGKWLKAVLNHHTSYVMSSPECEEILASMNAIIESRTRNYNKILQLRGKLEMMVQQVNAQPEDEQEVLEEQINKEALLVYQDDDDEDELKLDDMLMPASDTDNDDWDDQEEAEADDSEGEDVVEVEDDSDEDDEPLANGVSSEDDDDDMDAE